MAVSGIMRNTRVTNDTVRYGLMAYGATRPKSPYSCLSLSAAGGVRGVLSVTSGARQVTARAGLSLDWTLWLPSLDIRLKETFEVVTPRSVVRYFSRLFLQSGRLHSVQRSLYAWCVSLAYDVGLYQRVTGVNRQHVHSTAHSTLPLSTQVELRLLGKETGLAAYLPLVCDEQRSGQLTAQVALASWVAGVCFQRRLVVQPTVTTPAQVILWVSWATRLTYRIRYFALDRKVRKIVKNRYRYVRGYVCIREAQRLRHGLRLLPFVAMLQPDTRWDARLQRALWGLLESPETSLVRRLRHHHHRVTLRTLGLV